MIDLSVSLIQECHTKGGLQWCTDRCTAKNGGLLIINDKPVHLLDSVPTPHRPKPVKPVNVVNLYTTGTSARIDPRLSVLDGLSMLDVQR